MSELYEQIVGQRGSFERLAARVPGFRGYMDRQARRTADRMIRDYVAGEIRKRIQRLVEIEQSLLNSGSIAYMAETASAKSKLQHYHDRIRSAASGYSSPFEHIKIDAEDMEKLYNFDEAQIRYADLFDEALNKLAEAVREQANIRPMIAELGRLAVEANESFTMRETVLTNLSKLV